MTRAGFIPLSDIEWIRIHLNTKKRKSNKAGLKQLLKDTGGDMIFNAAIFLWSGDPCCHLKVGGSVKCKPDYTTWAISWDEPTDFSVVTAPNDKANYMACVKCIVAGNKVKMDYQQDMKYACNRTAIGTKDGNFAYYCTEDNLSPEALQDRLFDAGWDNAIMMDGGGSACCMDKDGNGFAADGRYIPFYLVVKLKETDKEPEGEKPMVEINAYSLKTDGSKYLTKHFRVKEFACQDGSDAVFIARELPMVCEYIRMRCNKGITINSGYRTITHNKKVGGVDNSQHVYGTAADLKTPSGFTPMKMASIAREIMPDWGGVGIYTWGIHVDVREKKSDWTG
jgi:hypothetical protein